MVQRCVEFVEEMAKDQSLHEPYVALMECLRTNTDGKIYVENERARLTLRLALLKEKNGWYYSFRFSRISRLTGRSLIGDTEF